MKYVLAVLVILVGGALIGLIVYIMNRVRQFSQMAFGTSDIVEGIRKQEQEAINRPKSLSGMTRIELPRIEKDFPGFNWTEWKKICENTLRSYLEAIEHGSMDYLKDASETIQKQASLIIDENQTRGIQEAFDDLHVHQTEIARYEKSQGLCKIKIQTAVQYMYSRTAAKKAQSVERRKEQHRYDMELVYVQDLSKVDEDVAYTFAGNCPNCGAPITRVGGAWKCQYCGTEASEAYSAKIWILNRLDKAN